MRRPRESTGVFSDGALAPSAVALEGGGAVRTADTRGAVVADTGRAEVGRLTATVHSRADVEQRVAVSVRERSADDLTGITRQCIDRCNEGRGETRSANLEPAATTGEPV